MKKVYIFGVALVGALAVFTGYAQIGRSDGTGVYAPNTTNSTAIAQTSVGYIGVNTNTSAPVVESNDTLSYLNTNYGFEVTLPKAWDGYVATERELDFGTSGKAGSVDFGFPQYGVTDSQFNISAFGKDQWQKIAADEGPKPVWIGESTEYVYAYVRAQDAPADDFIYARSSEIASIIESFRIVK